MATGATVSAGAGWQDFTPQAPPGGGWEDYKAPSAASPIAPPTLRPPQIPMSKVMLTGGTSENPDLQRPVTEQVGQVGAGMVKGLANASGPVTAHRLLQNKGIVGSGDLYSGEPDLKGNVNAAAQLTALGGIDAAEATPTMGTPRIPPPETAAEGPGMAMRLAKVGIKRIPGVKLAGDLVDAVRGPAPKPQPTVPPPVAIKDYGTPAELRGTRLPPPGSEALREGGRIPPPEPSSGLGQVKIGRPGEVYGRQELLENKGIQEGMREDMGRQQSAVGREAFDRSSPAISKRDMHDQINEENSIPSDEWDAGHEIGTEQENTPKPVIARPPKATAARGISAQPTTDGTDEDLTPLLKKSLARVRKAKEQ